MVGLVLVALALVVGVLSNWIDRPDWLPVPVVIVLLIAAAVGSYVLTNLDSGAGQEPSTEADGPGPAGGQLPATVRGRLLLTWDDSSGNPVLYSSRVDGTNRQRLGITGSNVRISFVPASTNVVMSNFDPRTKSQYLEIQSLAGASERRLTYPKPHFDDAASFSVARTQRQLYFARTHSVPAGPGTEVIHPFAIMRVPLDGSSREQVVRTPIKLRSISVSDDGSVLAGDCYPGEDGGPTQVCITGPAADSFVQIPGFAGAATDEPAVSPDGRYVAFSSIRDNPYGESEVYVYDRTSKKILEISKLPGRNGDIGWVPNSRTPCLAFSHYETSEQSVYIACLAPKVLVVKGFLNAYHPTWFD